MTRFDGTSSGAASGGDPYEFWDGAYVLGSLSSNERRDYETHLQGCASCREAVSEIGGMPALLGMLDRDDLGALDGREELVPPLRPEFGEALLAAVRWRGRRRRIVTWAGAGAAAAIVAFALMFASQLVVSVPAPEPPAASSVVAMQKVVPTDLDASVVMIGHRWGTSVQVRCTYRATPDEADDQEGRGDRLAMVVVGRDGSRTSLATWMAQPGVTALPSASTSMPINDIAAVQVVSADQGNVLLAHTL